MDAAGSFYGSALKKRSRAASLLIFIWPFWEPRPKGRGFFVCAQLAPRWFGLTRVRKQILLAALLLCVASSALALAQTTRPKVTPLSASEAALKKCPLHGTALTTEDVPIFYGYGGVPIPAPGYFEAQKRLFPYFHLGVSGGCMVSEYSPTLQAVKSCPKCRAAEKRWLAAHRKAGFVR